MDQKDASNQRNDDDVVNEANPFALPSNTGFRFFILILFILGATAQLPRLSISLVEFSRGEFNENSKSTQCSLKLYWDVIEELKIKQWPKHIDLDEINRRLAECTKSMPVNYRIYFIATFLAFAIVTTIYLIAVPMRFMRQGQLQPIPFERERFATLRKTLSMIEREAGVKAPLYVWQPLASDSPYLFAGLGRTYAYLSGAFVTELERDPQAFRSVMLHEFAHIRNNDVRLVFLTQALWWAFLIVVLLPAAITCVLGMGLDRGMQTIWTLNLVRVIVTGLLAYMLRCSLLRDREHDADVRASLDPACQQALIKTLGRGDKNVPSWRGAFSSYPTSGARIRAIQSPTALFSITPLEFFIIAFTILQFQSVPASLLLIAVQDQWPYQGQQFSMFSIPFLFYTPLAFITFGIALGRRRFARLVSGRDIEKNDSGNSMLALAATLGLWAGFAAAPVMGDIYLGLSPLSEASNEPVVAPSLTQNLVVHALGISMNFALFFISFIWLRRLADAWMPILTTTRHQATARVIGLVVLAVAGLALSVLPISLLVADISTKASIQILSESEDLITLLFLTPLALLYSPLNSPVVLAAGILPLAAVFFWWQRDPSRLASWAFWARPSVEAWPKTDRPPVKPIRAILIGVGVGLLASTQFQLDADALEGQFQTIADALDPIAEPLSVILSLSAEELAPQVWGAGAFAIISLIGMVVGALFCRFAGTAHGIVSGFVAATTVFFMTSFGFEAQNLGVFSVTFLGFAPAFALILPILSIVAVAKKLISDRPQVHVQ